LHAIPSLQVIILDSEITILLTAMV
jgi:hypothetical protein